MLGRIKEDLSEDEREEFYEDVLDSEGGIVTSVEISSKIKELCVQLAELDPVEYSKMCRSDDDAPKWQKKLDKDFQDLICQVPNVCFDDVPVGKDDSKNVPLREWGKKPKFSFKG